ncbi:uncharacterized protein Z519_02761 [Cladophialophora bantiana CBS 173.52]|uniref:Hypercellular protein HypA n=1 Tax=Cladophialophora bantiana (strain ATCC 10958 / CBS 173.52 / CDC B-1940 / NIH 8579) TaxID=1442370 RepID=A0A0D2IKN0_CLAB1|nr:uncharacterized protein Z519_02761 [Cladophialophora bantiana CBS 173.52]KIW97369.1 hypothetical protein Z519_02761 [Cladophialophora bantiana CBS 173.52]
MGYNPFLPTALARVNVLCVPAGPITPDRFQKFIKYLQNAATAERGVVESSSSSQETSQAGNGCILYDISANQDTRRPHLFPFETNTRCQVLLGLIDGERVANVPADASETKGVARDNVSATLDSIRVGFSERLTSKPGLVVRCLVYCGTEAISPLGDDVLSMPDSDAENTARAILANLSRRLLEGVRLILNDLKDQPISMVPGASSQTPGRTGTTPVQAERSSTPVPTRFPSPMLTSNGSEQQSDTSRGRFNVIQGMFWLQCGFWTDAMSVLSEGASIAQSGHDHLWHAKALENLLICMLLLSWSGLSFTLPQVCRSLPNRSGTFQAEVTPRSGHSLKILAQLLPPMVETVLELYAKVANLDLGGSLQDVLRECRVRLVNMLIFVKRAGGVLNRHGLNQIVAGDSIVSEQSVQTDGEPVAISKAGLANILIETLQEAQSSRNSSHYTSILVAVATSLSMLGLDRKHAFYIKQLMQQFVPKLIEARKIGASEAGVHPAAGLPPLSTALLGILPEMMVGTRAMLNLAAGAYGVPLPPIPEAAQRITADLNSIHDRLRIWAIEHSSGDVMLKLEMLRTCVTVCEALPDVPAGLHFTSNVLRGAKQIITMPKHPTDEVPLVPAEEQVRLLDGVKRAVSAASRLGAEGYRAEYWDDFLVRDIQVFEQGIFAKLIAHKPTDLAIRGSGRVDTMRDPFIYNPFSKDKSVAAAPVLVAGELAVFTVLLQNPLEVEIEIEEIGLLSEGCAFAPSRHSIVLGPFSTQMFTLSGTATGSGDLQIIGCRATIRNCYEQDFLTFRDDWKLSVMPKYHAVGRLRSRKEQASDGEGSTKYANFPLNPPAAMPLKLQVIGSQPRLVAKSSSLSNPAIMLLEGECRVFDLTLVNESQTVAADFVLVTTEDSVTARLQDALTNKDLNPAESYEIQNQLTVHPAVDIKDQRDEDSSKVLEPGQSIAYQVTIFGRAGLVSATVQANYAYLGSPSSEVKGTFYTRQIRFPISVTVNGCVEIPRCNIFPIHSDFSWNSGVPSEKSTELDANSPSGISGVAILSNWLQSQPDASRYCILSLDLRNVWPQPLHIELQARKSNSESLTGEQLWEGAYSVTETLQPGHVSRVILLVPRLFIQDPHAPIPNLDTQKQFVVTASKLSVEAEATSRESFWYREELLKCLRGTWQEEGSVRHGEIDLRKGVRLSPRMVDALKIDHVEIEFAVRPHEKTQEVDGNGKTAVSQIGKSHFVVKTEVFATLSATIHNHTQEALRLILRLQPALRHQPHNIALDLTKRFTWTGVLQRALHPAVEPGGVCVAELGIIALADGEYEINASVEEISRRRTPNTAKSSEVPGAVVERRIWHARSPCLIDAMGA